MESITDYLILFVHIYLPPCTLLLIFLREARDFRSLYCIKVYFIKYIYFVNICDTIIKYTIKNGCILLKKYLYTIFDNAITLYTKKDIFQRKENVMKFLKPLSIIFACTFAGELMRYTIPLPCSCKYIRNIAIILITCYKNRTSFQRRNHRQLPYRLYACNVHSCGSRNHLQLAVTFTYTHTLYCDSCNLNHYSYVCNSECC